MSKSSRSIRPTGSTGGNASARAGGSKPPAARPPLQRSGGGQRHARLDAPRSTSTLQERLPNGLSLARLIATPLIVLLLLAAPTQSIPAAVLFSLASITDYLDGYLARRWKVVSQFGVFCDLVADKLLVSATLIALIGIGRVASWVVIIIVGRELLVSGLRAWAAAQGVVIPAGIWGKGKTLVTLIATVVVMLDPASPAPPVAISVSPVSTALILLAALLTLLSAIDYVYQAWRIARR